MIENHAAAVPAAPSDDRSLAGALWRGWRRACPACGEGALELLAFDVLHDLAVLRPAQAGAFAGRGAVDLRPESEPLPRGAGPMVHDDEPG